MNQPYFNHENSQEKFETYYRQLEKLEPLKPKKKKTSSLKSWLPMFSAFMTGAIIVSGLAFASDKMNLFTGEQKELQAVSSNSSIANSNIVHASYSSASSSVSDIYAEASKAVVKIETYSLPDTSSMFNDSRMWMYFSEQGADERNRVDRKDSYTEEELQLSGSGTGFVFDQSGYIFTNEHVVHDAKQIMVTIHGQEEPIAAQVVSASEEQDIAVLKVDVPNGESLPVLPLGDSDYLEVGQWVMAIGNPYGYDYTLTMGVISAKERPITIENSDGEPQVLEHMLQTDTSINPGNSGGPLLDESGYVIGMNTAVSSEAQGIGFAIPTNVLIEYLRTLNI